MLGKVYHERQVGHLCGVHCVNNLLQGPQFGPGDFAEIGVRLDKQERKLLGSDEPAVPEGAVATVGSENFDASADGGNFSIQVLRIALARAGLKIVPADHPDGQKLMHDPANSAGAYLVQRRDHWQALRKVGPCWWDLDSMLRGPRPLDDRQFLERLSRLNRGQSSVFLILGKVPEPLPPSAGETGCSDAFERQVSSDNWHDVAGLLDPAVAADTLSLADVGRQSCSTPDDATLLSPKSPKSPSLNEGDGQAPNLDFFCQHEVRAALALAGGRREMAADMLWKAHRNVEKLLAKQSPNRLATALATGVDAVLTAQRSLPETVARLVVLLCAPTEELLASAAALVDCGDLAHRLLTALAKKARGWLWTEGLAQAATVAVERLLSLPPLVQVDRLTVAAALDVDDNDAAPQELNKEEDDVDQELKAAFEAMDNMLGENTPPEGLPGKPSVSAFGLKAPTDSSLPRKNTATARRKNRGCDAAKRDGSSAKGSTSSIASTRKRDS